MGGVCARICGDLWASVKTNPPTQLEPFSFLMQARICCVSRAIHNPMRVCRNALFIQHLHSGRRVHANTAKHDQHVPCKGRDSLLPTSSTRKRIEVISLQGVEGLVAFVPCDFHSVGVRPNQPSSRRQGDHYLVGPLPCAIQVRCPFRAPGNLHATPLWHGAQLLVAVEGLDDRTGGLEECRKLTPRAPDSHVVLETLILISHRRIMGLKEPLVTQPASRA